MARHRQPLELAVLKGQDKVHPERYNARKEAPKAAYGLGEPPPSMDEAGRAVWFELETYALLGVLTCADRLLLELTSNLVAEYRQAPQEFRAPKIGHLISCLARLGMTPADRQKLGTAKKPEENEFNQF